jgi:hypothetical protein
MSWLITPQYLGAAVSDPDAQAYLRAVETADNQGPLEQGVQQAVNQFVIGCKADGIWNAIKASCILAGARTLNGALVPLVGAAPTNFDFVSGDYNRKTGLVGNGTTKYLNSNRNNNADPQNSNHNAVYVSVAGGAGAQRLIGGNSGTYQSGDNSIPIGSDASAYFLRSRTSSASQILTAPRLGLNAINRNSSSTYSYRLGNLSGTLSVNSQTSSSTLVRVFAGGSDSTVQNPTDARLAFYSIGESLDLALLDARVTTLIQAIDAAI